MIIPVNDGRVVAYQQWLNGERRLSFCPPGHTAPSPLVGEGAAPPGQPSPRENPIAPRLQPDRIADPELAVARRVDLDLGVAFGERDRRARPRAEAAHIGQSTWQRPATRGADQQVMPAHEQG